MSERLIALADAADAMCDCEIGRKPTETFISSEGHYRHTANGGSYIERCGASGIRRIVEREHPCLGSRPTSEWRRKESKS
jgi:hypothetical protein